MSAPPYMRLYWTDYFGATRTLNRHQHSAYLLLLGEMWVRGGRLKADDQTLATMTLTTAEEWADVKPVVLAFFKVSRGWLTQKRLTEERTKYLDKVGKLKEAGKLGSTVTNGKRKRTGAANADKKSGKSRHNQKGIILNNTFPGVNTEARLDGASCSHTAEGGAAAYRDDDERAWSFALAEADAELLRCRRSDPDHASELSEFIEAAKAKLRVLRHARLQVVA